MATNDNGAAPQNEPLKVTIAVRALTEFLCREGDIHYRYDTITDAREGIQAQRMLQRDRPAAYQRERRVIGRHTAHGVELRLTGRVDGCDLSPETALVEEIKATREDADKLHRHAGAPHTAQLQLYAAMLAQETGRGGDWQLRLSYCHPDSLQTRDFESTCNSAELIDYFERTCDAFCRWIAALAAHRQRRNSHLTSAMFPHPQMRSQQRALARHAFRTFRDGGVLLAEAPTGIGKTLGALFPALKGMAGDHLDRAVFLTSRGTGQITAADAAATVGGSGNELRTITITARDKTCFMPEPVCDPDVCSYARGYYDRRMSALDALFGTGMLSRAMIEATAREYHVCPFELSLDAAVWSDVIICDYNYLFDPVVQLQRIRGMLGERIAVLIDEAHQLPERVRDMLSAEFRREWLQPLTDRAGAAGRSGAGQDNTDVRRFARALDRRLLAIRRAALAPFDGQSARLVQPEREVPGPPGGARPGARSAGSQAVAVSGASATAGATGATGVAVASGSHAPGSAVSEGRDIITGQADRAKPISARDGAVASIPASLAQTLDALITAIQSAARIPAGPKGTPEASQTVLNLTEDAFAQRFTGTDERELLFRLLRFQRALSGYQPDDYLVSISGSTADLCLQLRCLDPGAHIASVLRQYESAVAFSATLTPLTLFHHLHGLADARTLRVPSPFDPAQLGAFLIRDIDVRYRARQRSLDGLVALIADVAGARPGNYLVALPSFEYLTAVADAFVARHPAWATCSQSRNMSISERQAFLDAFRADGGPVLGFAVLGGVFTESIDLPGDALIGMIVVGLGLPPPSLERDHYAARIRQQFADSLDSARDARDADSLNPGPDARRDADSLNSRDAVTRGARDGVRLNSLPEAGDADSLDTAPDAQIDLDSLDSPEGESSVASGADAARIADSLDSRSPASSDSDCPDSGSRASSESDCPDSGSRASSDSDCPDSASRLSDADSPDRAAASARQDPGSNRAPVAYDDVSELTDDERRADANAASRPVSAADWAAGEDPGFIAAYQQPAMTRVVQAAGRLIRSEQDRGILCLVDDRFAQPAYQRYFPDYWRVQVTCAKSLRAELDAFWNPG